MVLCSQHMHDQRAHDQGWYWYCFARAGTGRGVRGRVDAWGLEKETRNQEQERKRQLEKVLDVRTCEKES